MKAMCLYTSWKRKNNATWFSATSIPFTNRFVGVKFMNENDINCDGVKFCLAVGYMIQLVYYLCCDFRDIILNRKLIQIHIV
uniref:Uncharacterized protein n=1 Tax=Solanum lycopersicum TaxID=4081 RepID=A0A3Q7J1V4_SOLLC